MRKCSYTWEEWNREKNEIVEKRCPEEIWKGSDKFCIFHDPFPEKDVELFEQKMGEKTDGNFRGYFFPEGWDFQNKEFHEDANFIEATFQEYADFRRATFEKNADFSRAGFQKKADFIEATFQEYADFTRTIFQEYADFTRTIFQDASFIGAIFQDANFRETTFQDASFIGATFHDANFRETTFQDASFIGATFHDAYFDTITVKESFEFNSVKVSGIIDFRGAKFFFSGSITVDLERTKFHRAHLQNVDFIDCNWPKDYIIFEEKKMANERLSFNELETIYRNLKQNMQHHGDYSTAGEFYIREMECRKKAMRRKRFSANWFKSFGYSILKYTCGYGEKPVRVIRNSLLIILLGAILFFFSGVARVGAEIPSENSPYEINYSLDSLSFSRTTLTDFYYCFYYSVVTFTTLGYGDIHPIGCYSHAIAFSEAFTGAFFMALFVVVFARKMMR